MKTIANLIQQNLQQEAAKLIELEKIVMSALPSGCNGHVNVAGIRDNQLILVTDSPVWASKIRLHQQNLLQMLKEHAHISFAGITVKQSQTDKVNTNPKTAKLRHLDRQSARLIQQTADSVTDPALKQALQHLAKNTLPLD